VLARKREPSGAGDFHIGLGSQKRAYRGRCEGGPFRQAKPRIGLSSIAFGATPDHVVRPVPEHDADDLGLRAELNSAPRGSSICFFRYEVALTVQN
jgi:hypothetical protein